MWRYINLSYRDNFEIFIWKMQFIYVILAVINYLNESIIYIYLNITIFMFKYVHKHDCILRVFKTAFCTKHVNISHRQWKTRNPIQSHVKKRVSGCQKEAKGVCIDWTSKSIYACWWLKLERITILELKLYFWKTNQIWKFSNFLILYIG